jgi:SHOCT-like protein
MSEETRKVLEMLAEGKINAGDADKLLEKLAAAPSAQTPAAEKSEEPAESGSKKPRFLRIVVDKPGQEQVNIRMPLAFAGSGSRLLAVLPARVGEKLSEMGVDLSALGSKNEEDWVQAIGNANIEVEKGTKKVRIFCE